MITRTPTLWRSACLSTLFASALSCSDGTNPLEPREPARPPLPPPTGPVTGTILPSGGTVSATTDEGVVVTLSFPAAAVRAPTEVTLRPLTPAADRWMTVALEPAGLIVRRGFEVDLRFPEQIPLQNPTLLLASAAGPVPVRTVFDAQARKLTTTMGFTGAAPGTPVLVASSHLHALGAGDDANTLSAGPVDCQTATAYTERIFNDFLASGADDFAVQAALAVAYARHVAGCPGLDAWLQTASDLTCSRYEAAVEFAAARPTNSYGDFVAQTKPIVNWAAIGYRLGLDCVDNVHQVLDSEMRDYLTFHHERLERLTSHDWNTFSDLKEEAVDAYSLYAHAYKLELEELGDEVETRAFRPAAARMRRVGYGLCREYGWHYPLSRLTSTGFFSSRDVLGLDPPRSSGFIPPAGGYAGFTDQEIFSDLQHCGTDIELEAHVASGGRLAGEKAGSGGTPGEKIDQITLEAPTRGTLHLSGEIFAFTCWNEVPGDSEVIVALNGTDVLTLRRGIGGRYIQGSPVVLDIGEAASEAGITPREGWPHELTIRRKRDRCDDRLWGDATFELLSATLEWKNPQLEVEVEFPDRVQPGASVEALVRVAVIDRLGEAAYYNAIDVELEVTGASAAATQGQTDADGYFRTTILVPTTNVSTSAGITSAARSGTVTIGARATSFEGVSAQSSSSAAIADPGGRAVFVHSQFDVAAGTHAGHGDATAADSDEDRQFAVLGYANSVSASTSLLGMSAKGEASGNLQITIDPDTEAMTGYTAGGNVSFEASRDTVGSSAGSAVSEMSVIFDVVGGEVEFGVLGSMTASKLPGFNGSHGTSYLLELKEVDPRDGRTIREIIYYVHSDSQQTALSVDDNGVLKPGRYRIVHSVSTGGQASSSCGSRCRIDADGNHNVTLTLGQVP